MKHLAVLFIFVVFVPLHAWTQSLEIAGKAIVTDMELKNMADSVVVVTSDGTLARRDVSTLTQLQILSISNDTVFLTNGGFVKLPADMVDDADADPTNEVDTWSTLAGIPAGFADDTDDVDDNDADVNNEIQTIAKSGSTVTLSNSGGSFTDSVDDADADPTNEIQTIAKSGSTVTLSNSGGAFTDSVDDADADPANEFQTIAKSGSTVTLSNSGGAFTDSVDDADADPANEIQTISRSGIIVTLSDGGGSFNDSLDNLGNHMASQNIQLNNLFLSNDGDNEGIKVDSSGNIGIGTSAPDTTLHVVGKIKIVDGNQASGKIMMSDSDGMSTWTDANDGLPVPDTTKAIPIRYHGSYRYIHPTDSAADVAWTAAQTACDNLTSLGFDDWYLPTKGELDAMYKQSYLITGLSDTASAKYWSSTEMDGTNAYTQRLDYGGPDPDAKTDATGHNSRCIRKN